MIVARIIFIFESGIYARANLRVSPFLRDIDFCSLAKLFISDRSTVISSDITDTRQTDIESCHFRICFVQSTARAYRNHVPPETIPVSLNLADRRRLSSVDTLLPVALHFRRWLVLVLVIVPGLLPLTNLLLSDLGHRGRRGRDGDRLSLNGTLLCL